MLQAVNDTVPVLCAVSVAMLFANEFVSLVFCHSVSQLDELFKLRVATNLEYSGISLNMENSWNSLGILCKLREKL